ncbi:MAG: hypothetical protein JWM12_3224 [Ilumatobacteraceae bacterium]|nr:hypothetical protein [Ilumatobacteraceae bacterium]
MASCAVDTSGGPTSATRQDPTTRRQLEPLDGVQLQDAESWSAALATRLVQDHPELAGLTVSALFPVFDEDTPQPVGVMARLALPAAVPAVTMDLVRSHHGTPEPITSLITNLRGLDVIRMFATQRVVIVGVTPQEDDAADPATATKVRPVEPEQHRDPDFESAD